jgi:hypothetical protein
MMQSSELTVSPVLVAHVLVVELHADFAAVDKDMRESEPEVLLTTLLTPDDV